ncbi:MAG: thioesterase, partial [Bacilli bacterium]|nr:thioesterase [Bacilli bacterium]
MEKLFWEKEYTITTNSFDCYDRLSLVGILDLLQDAAGYHAALLGLGFLDLKAKGITWLLVRTKFIILKSGPMTRKVKVKTWQSYKKRVDYERDYLVCDENDEILIKGTSKWCLIDIN